MIKHILIDLDDTVLDFRRCEAEALKLALAECGIEPTEHTVRRYSEINDAGWKKLEAGLITRERLLVWRFEELFSELGVIADAEEVNAAYKLRLSEQCFFVDGAPEMLDALYGKYRLYLASNGTAVVQDGRIARAGIAKYFDRIFISQRLGFNKPDPRFFDAAFDAIGDVKREETVIVGDSPSSDIRGGMNAGIRTVWFDPDGKALPPGITPTFIVRTLAEVPSVIGRI